MHDLHMPRRSQPRRQTYRPTFIREWRLHRQLTQERLASRLGTTHASVSRIESGKTPYSQPMLEAIAEALGTDPASLIMRNPLDPEGIWSVWDQAKPIERRQIVEIAKAIINTRKSGT